jgi:hypothetical protein
MNRFEPAETSLDAAENRRITLSNIVTVAFVVVLLGWGWIMRGGAVNATVPFRDEINGINAQIPANWLLTEKEAGIVFRVEDPQARPFKTTIQISLQVVGDDAEARNIVDLLKLQGPLQLSGYRALSEETFKIGEDDAVRINYAYVSQELNPFLESLPIVVRGEDVVVLRGNQAVIITFRDADQSFDAHYFYFENFLATLEY